MDCDSWGSYPVRRTLVAPLTVLLLWINGYRHEFTTDEGFDLVVRVAAGNTELQESAGLISRQRNPTLGQPEPSGKGVEMSTP